MSERSMSPRPQWSDEQLMEMMVPIGEAIIQKAKQASLVTDRLANEILSLFSAYRRDPEGEWGMKAFVRAWAGTNNILVSVHNYQAEMRTERTKLEGRIITFIQLAEPDFLKWSELVAVDFKWFSGNKERGDDTI